MKHSFTLSLLLLATAAFAQTEKGNSFVSGNISTGYSAYIPPKNASNKSNNFSISTGISYGKFVKDNIVWRIDVSETFNRIFWQNGSGPTQTIGTTQPNTSISLRSLGLYYFGKDRWRGFVGGGIKANGNFSKTEITNSGDNRSQKRSSLSVNPVFEAGAVYFFNKQLGLQLAATANSFPIDISGFSTGFLYWIKPTSFDIDSKEFTTLQKGRWMLGAGFGINTERYKNNNPYQSTTNEESGNGGNVNIELGKFIKDRTKIGLSLGYSLSKNIQSYSDPISSLENKARNFSAGIFLKRYIIPARFTPYFGVGINYFRVENKQLISNSDDIIFHNNSYGLDSSIGLAYVISNHFLVEAQLASLYLNYTPKAKTISANLSGGLRPNLRLSYVF